MADGQDGGFSPFGDFGQRRKRPAHVLVTVAVDVAAEVGRQRVDDHKCGLVGNDGLLQGFTVIREGQESAIAVGHDGSDPSEVGTGGCQAWLDGVRQTIFGRRDEHVGRGDAPRFRASECPW